MPKTDSACWFASGRANAGWPISMSPSHLLGLPNVRVEEWPCIADAMAWHTEGLDFADTLHLLASGHCTEFMSFDDRRFARRAKRLGVTPAVVVPAK